MCGMYTHAARKRALTVLDGVIGAPRQELRDFSPA
jgi:hypothetical protein